MRLPDDGGERRSLAPAVTRAAAVLAVLRDASRPYSLTELSRALRLPKSSLLNICGALESARLVRRTDLGYELGPATVSLGGAYLSSNSVVVAFHQAVEREAGIGGLAIQLAVPGEGNTVVFLGRSRAESPIQVGIEVGRTLPASTSAAGKAMLARMTPHELELAVGEGDLPRLTEFSIPDSASLRRELEQVRRVGYATEAGDSVVGISAVAIAVGSSAGLAAVTAVGLTPQLLHPDQVAGAITIVNRIASELEALGEASSGEGTP